MKKTALITAILATAQAMLMAAALPESQMIDQILAKDWQKRNLTPNPPASDAVLVRRLYLDIAGRIPTVEETEAFLKSSDPQKRAKLIDQLLASDGYTSHMFNYWADVLRLTDNARGKITARAYAEYVKQQLKQNTPYDQFVKALLTTDGGVWDSGAVGFYQRDENKLDHLAYTVQVFLGTSIVCAQCHNHPFDKWTQMDYYGMAAYTYGMDIRAGYNPLQRGKGDFKKVSKEELVKMAPQERQNYIKERQKVRDEFRKGMVDKQDLAMVRNAMQDVMRPLRYTQISWTDSRLPSLPQDYQYQDGKPGQKIEPRVIFGHDAVAGPGETRLDAFANWMTAPENPRFTTVIANRMWKKVFGMGLIEPVDEMTDSTVPSNGELMEYLNELMMQKRYSLKSFLRVLYNTDTYQRMATPTEVELGGTYYFTGPLLRRMSAEQVWDSLVTLSKGNVDSTISTDDAQLHEYLGDLKDLMEAIKDKSVPELVALAKEGVERREVNQAKLKEITAQISSKAGTPEGQVLVKQAQRLRRESTRDLLVGILGEEEARDLMQGYGGAKNGGKNGKASKVNREELAKLSKADRIEAIRIASQMQLNLRASELPSPTRPGHFLRTFGQSDREIIENASDDASVPQALALLNGPATEMIYSPLSKLRQELEAISDPEKKMERLYVAFFSRRPSATEQAMLREAIKERGDSAVADVTHALLSGSQFIYVQ